MTAMGNRKGELVSMHPIGSRMRLEFLIPSRGLFGYKSQMLTDTRGEGIMSSVFHEYQPYKGDISSRTFGSLIAYETGDAITYGLFNAQGRGRLLVRAGDPVYMGISGKRSMIEAASPVMCFCSQRMARGSYPALRATLITLGLSAIKMPFSGSMRLRNCASVSVAKISTPGCCKEVISMIAII
jgi:hypothetical protein